MTNILMKKLLDYKQKFVVARMLADYRNRRYDKLGNLRLADLGLLETIDQEISSEIHKKMNQMTKERFQKKGKVKVAFVLYSAAMWSCSDLYNKMKIDDRFEPYVVVAKYTNESNKKTWPTFNMTRQFFERENYNYIIVSDRVASNRGWDAMGRPDIVFYLTPYHTLLPVGINQGYLPGKVITIYIPYSYMLIKAEEKYNVPAFRYSWRHFCDSEIYRSLLIQYNPQYEKNTYFVGYPKMDAFYCKKDIEDSKLWKMDGNNKKKIIYAPHHSLKDLDYCSSHFSTFDKNYHFMLKLAQKYSDTTTWIYKPHPNLKKTVVMANVFRCEEDYDNYLRQWDALPNAKVVQEGTYIDYFLSSDAMICDSVSFLAEYQFTGKPLLLLTRPEQVFNKFGEMVQSILYKCPGEDLKGIEQFVSNVVIDGRDTMKNSRDSFFKENLDYYHKNGCLTASEQIFKEICIFCFEN